VRSAAFRARLAAWLALSGYRFVTTLSEFGVCSIPSCARLATRPDAPSAINRQHGRMATTPRTLCANRGRYRDEIAPLKQRCPLWNVQRGHHPCLDHMAASRPRPAGYASDFPIRLDTYVNDLKASTLVQRHFSMLASEDPTLTRSSVRASYHLLHEVSITIPSNLYEIYLKAVRTHLDSSVLHAPTPLPAPDENL